MAGLSFTGESVHENPGRAFAAAAAARSRRCGKRAQQQRYSLSDTDEDQLSDAGIEVEDDDDDLDHVATGSKPASIGCGGKLALATPRIDSYRLSRANLEDSQDVELDAILGELCALETQFDKEIMQRGHARSASAHAPSLDGILQYPGQNHPQQRYSTSSSVVGFSQPMTPTGPLGSLGPQGGTPGTRILGHSRSSSGGTRPKFEMGSLQIVDVDGEESHGMSKRTDSPDNDSAFSDNVSMLSSESSASSGASNAGRTGDPNSSHSMSSKSSNMSLATSPTQLFIKAFSADNSAKSLLVDERMSVGIVCRLLADKNHVTMDPKWAVVELIPDLYMERIYEDHESLVENLLLWTRDSCNKLLFLERYEKFDLFSNPEDYLLGMTSSESGTDLDDDGKQTLIEEFFTTSGVGVPEVEGSLFLKSDGKKAWKKYFFVLRASGLYYSPKGKSKFSKDLICLTTFEMNNVYGGLGWKKKYKAPTDYGFAIKHPQIQTKSSKYIKYLCAEDERTLKQWVMGIRIAKYAIQLKENYDSLMRDIEEEDLDTLAHARSFSMSSMAKTLQVSPDGSGGSPESLRDREISNRSFQELLNPPLSPLSIGSPVEIDPDNLSNRSSNSTPTPTATVERNWRRGSNMGRQDSIRSSASSSSGCMSERSGCGTPTAEQIAFDADFPVGTIKRKPSMTPKIPLTSTTRNLAKQSAGEEGLTPSVRSSPEETTIKSPESCNTGNNGGVGSLGRNAGRFTLRRSQTDDRIHVNGVYKSKHDLQQVLPQRSNSIQHYQVLPIAQNQNHYEVIHQKAMITQKSPTKSISPERSPIFEAPSDVEDEFPLPPPPLDFNPLDPEDCLPPPPPEAFKGSTLSLDSLPPPPPPLGLGDECSWPSTSSLNSLPPPPSPLVQSPTKQSPDSRSSTPEAMPMPSSPNKISPTVPPKPNCNGRSKYRRMSETDVVTPPYLSELKQGHNGVSPPHTIRKGKWRKMSADPSTIGSYGTNPRSPPPPLGSGSSSNSSSSSTLSPTNSLSPKRMFDRWGNAMNAPGSPISGMYSPTESLSPTNALSPQSTPPAIPQHQGYRYQQPTQPIYQDQQDLYGAIQANFQQRPPPHRRQSASAALRRSCSVTPSDNGIPLPGPIPNPPETFLKDLQRVMEKKWKVAQQLTFDLAATPHEILGFRDSCYLAPNEGDAPHPVSVTSPGTSKDYYDVPSQLDLSSRIVAAAAGPGARRLSHVSPEEMGRTFVISRKKAPPPPPKRSETTQLSRR